MTTFYGKTGLPYVAPKVQKLSVMDKKIAALTQAFHRIARVYPGVLITESIMHPGARKFVALFKARNRRTRVLMRRVQRVTMASRNASATVVSGG